MPEQEISALAGCHVLVGRARPGKSEIASRLRLLGAEVLEGPEVQVQRLLDSAGLDTALCEAHKYQSIIFACSTSVEVIFALSRELGCEFHMPMIAIGEQAHNALRRFGVTPCISTKGACRPEISAHLGRMTGTSSLLLTSANGRPNLCEDLHDIGISVQTLAVYRCDYQFENPLTPTPDLFIVPSSSVASLLLNSDWGPALKCIPVVAMGEQSARCAHRLGVRTVIQAECDTVDAVVACASVQLVKKKIFRESVPTEFSVK